MKQAVSIFWKDVRHMWLDLSVYGLLLTVLTLVSPHTWLGRTEGGGTLGMFVDLLVLLLAVCWLVIIARAVQEDRLAGQEQFWVTRPYHWTSLLAGKLLFVAVCVVAPFLLMQWALLFSAGLNPLTAGAGMSVSLLLFTLIVWLPFVMIASVTEGLAMAFTLLAGILIVWAGLLTWIISGSDIRTSPPYVFELFTTTFGVLLSAILIYQYSQRRTLHSRFAITAALMLFLLLVLGYDKSRFGAPVQALIRHQYPVAAGGGLHLVYMSGPLGYEDRREASQIPHGYVEVKFPVRIEGVPPERKLHGASILVEIKAGSDSYKSPWQTAKLGDHAISFFVPEKIFDRFAEINAAVHLEVAAEELSPRRTGEIRIADKFVGPAGGACELVRGKVYCRYAYHQEVPAKVEADVRSGMCDEDSLRTQIAVPLRWVPAGTIADPVVSEAWPFQGQICTGDSVTFTEYSPAGKFRLLLDVPAVKLSEYRLR